MPVSRLDFGTAAANDGEEISTAFVKLDANDALLEAAIDALSAATTVLAAAIDAIEADYVVAADIASMLETSDIGSTVQAYDADLDSWASVARATGFDTFVATPSSDNLAALLTDETGTGGGFVRATGPTISGPTFSGNIAFPGTSIWNSSGNVGIGTTSPAGNLDVVTGVYRGYFDDASGSYFRFTAVNAANSAYGPIAMNGSVVALQVSNTEYARLNSDGTFGVGTTSPGSKLHVADTNASADVSTIIENLSTAASTAKATALTFRGRDTINSPKNIGQVLATLGDANCVNVHMDFLTRASDSMAAKMRLTDVGNLKVGGTAARATTEGTNQIVLFDGTAPAGTLANGCSFYSTSGEMRVMDAAGNATLLSPHDKATNEWIYDSIDTRTGRRLRIDMERMMRALNDAFGWDFVTDSEGS